MTTTRTTTGTPTPGRPQPPAAYFDTMAAHAGDHWWYRARRELVAQLLQGRLCGGGTALDIGCGTGEVVDLLVRLGASLAAGTDLSDPGGEVTLVVENALKTYTIMPTVSLDLVRMHSGGRLRSGLGLLLERWEIPFEPGRNRVGGVGLLSLEVPLFGGFVASATGTFGVTPASPFKAEELPSPYRPTALWRRGIAAVLSYRL